MGHSISLMSKKRQEDLSAIGTAVRRTSSKRQRDTSALQTQTMTCPNNIAKQSCKGGATSTYVSRSEDTTVSHPSQTQVDSIGDLGSIGAARKGELSSDSEGEGTQGRAKRVGVSRNTARVGVGEQSSESGTEDNLNRLGGCVGGSCRE